MRMVIGVQDSWRELEQIMCRMRRRVIDGFIGPGSDDLHLRCSKGVSYGE